MEAGPLTEGPGNWQVVVGSTGHGQLNSRPQSWESDLIVRKPGMLAISPWAASGGWSGAPQIPPDFGQNWPWGSQRECLDEGRRVVQSGPGSSRIRRAHPGFDGQFLYLEFAMTLRCSHLC